MRTSLFFVVVLAVFFLQPTAALQQPPIMGILVNPFVTYNNTLYCISDFDSLRGEPFDFRAAAPTTASSGCVWSVYVQWLQMSGLRVIPIPWDANETHMTYLLDRVNGLLLPGGILLGHPVIDAYFQTVQFVVARAKYYNEVENDSFVLWGTCQGFELLFSAAAGTMDILTDGLVGTDPKMLPIQFLQNDTKMFEGFPPSLLEAMETKPLTLNLHTKGIVPSSLLRYPNVTKMLIPTSTSQDATGVTFIASAESPDPLRIFTSQFHPERPPFDFGDDGIGHGPETLMVSQLLSLRAKKALMESKHRFEHPEEAERLMIDNAERQNLGWGIEVYYL